MASNTSFKSTLVDTAEKEYERLGSLRRGDAGLRERVAQYLQRLGIAPPADLDSYHWSAVFISWCMRSAGASDMEFPTAAGHWEYAVRALKRSSGLFVGHQLEKYAPQPGDLLHVNRDGGKITFDQAKSSDGYYPAESGIITEIQNSHRGGSYVLGNDPNGTVGHQTFSTDGNGLVVQRTVDPFICIIEVRK